MLKVANLNTTYIAIEHNPTDDRTVASFEWSIAHPKDTYTIDATERLSVELDRAFGIRPAGVTLVGSEDQASLDAITHLFGEDFTHAMVSAKTTGMCALKLTLDEESRLAIAEMQLASPSTPVNIRGVCKAVATSLSAKRTRQKSTPLSVTSVAALEVGDL